MSAFPNPLANIVDPSLLQAPAARGSGYPQADPQLGILVDQKAQEMRVFQLLILKKRAGQAAQEHLSSRLTTREVETLNVQGGSQDSLEMKWLVENRSALEAYRGEWLLISGNSLIVHCADFGEVRRAIADRRIRSPFVYYVPAQEESNFIAF
jgi:hypothetical protein